MESSKKIKIPFWVKLGRSLTLIVCIPTAIILTTGTLIQSSDEIIMVVQDKDINHSNVRGEEVVSHRLYTDKQTVYVSPFFYYKASVGDSLRISRGIIDFKLIAHKEVEIIRNDEVVEREYGGDLRDLLLFVVSQLLPLFGFEKYEKWKGGYESYYMPAILIIIPFSTLLFWVLAIFI